MEPGKTSFFQALGVPTKIARGTIEITTDLKLVERGAKVGASEATLLNMLNISPFTYGMKVEQVYESGQSFSPDVLDIEESQLLKALNSAIAIITTVSLAANYPTLPSVIHSVVNAYKNAIAVAIETDYSWEGLDDLKDRIANPDAYAAAAPAAGAGGAAEAAAPEAAKEEEKEEGMSIHPLHLPQANLCCRERRVRRRHGLRSFRLSASSPRHSAQSPYDATPSDSGHLREKIDGQLESLSLTFLFQTAHLESRCVFTSW